MAGAWVRGQNAGSKHRGLAGTDAALLLETTEGSLRRLWGSSEGPASLGHRDRRADANVTGLDADPGHVPRHPKLRGPTKSDFTRASPRHQTALCWQSLALAFKLAGGGLGRDSLGARRIPPPRGVWAA